MKNLEKINFTGFLDQSVNPIFFLNKSCELIYCNQAAIHFFEKNQVYFREMDPLFQPNELGRKLAVFEKLLMRECQEILALKQGQFLEKMLAIDILHLNCHISPIFSVDGIQQGVGFEVQDRTILLRTLSLLEEAIHAAEEGNFEHKLSLEYIIKENPDFALISQKINILFEVIQNFFGDIICVLDDLMHGKTINNDIETIPDGFFGTTKEDLNQVLSRFRQFIQGIAQTSNLMLYTLENSHAKNILMAISSAQEEEKIYEVETQLRLFLEKLRHSNLEIYQGVEIAGSLKNNDEIVRELRTMFQSIINDIFDRVIYMLNIIKTINFTLRGHLDVLRASLYEVKIGNIGKGIHGVTQECEAMISTTNELMQNIYHAFSSINQRITEKQVEIDEIFEILASKLYSMMSVILEEIRKNLNSHNEFTDEVLEMIDDVKELHQLTEKTSCVSDDFTKILSYLMENLSKNITLFEAGTQKASYSVSEKQYALHAFLTQYAKDIGLSEETLEVLFK